MQKNLIKIIGIAKEWMHGWITENSQKIEIKLEYIWIDLIRSIYAPYMYSFFTFLLLLIPKSKLTPRSISMPRSQPIPSYPLYSSLVFRCSQVPISIATKHPAQP